MKIIKFGAEWCSPCKAMKPIIERVFNDEKYSDIRFLNIDVDEDDEDLSGKFKVRNVPTIIVVNDKDEVLDKLVGTFNETKLRDFIGTWV